MSWLSPTPRAGDWVALTQTTPVDLGDHLTGGGAPVGTPALVTSTGWRHVQIELPDGRRTTVSPQHLRLTHRSGGEQAFRNRSQTRALIRTAAQLAMVAPVIYYALWHLWAYRTTDEVFQR